MLLRKTSNDYFEHFQVKERTAPCEGLAWFVVWVFPFVVATATTRLGKAVRKTTKTNTDIRYIKRRNKSIFCYIFFVIEASESCTPSGTGQSSSGSCSSFGKSLFLIVIISSTPLSQSISTGRNSPVFSASFVLLVAFSKDCISTPVPFNPKGWTSSIDRFG